MTSSKSKGEYNLAAANDGTNRGPPPKKGRFSFIYDPDEGSFLGRTAKSWLLIFVFYLIYYTCLAAFFGGMLSVFLYSVIQNEKPHLTGHQSLIRMNPGIGFRPQPDVESSLISFTAGKNESYASYVQNLEMLYNKYKERPIGIQTRDCSANSTEPEDPNKICQFNWNEQLPNCTPQNKFGYELGQPCVVLKMNRVFGWLPDSVDPAVPHPTVHCYGENSADAENIGQLIYQPGVFANSSKASGYFSNAYFPYLNQPGYQAPLVAVIFDKLPANTLVMVECRLGNLEGINYSRQEKESMVRFDIFVKK